MRVLIVGAGVAGPVTAMALQQVGIEAAIFESYPPSDGEVGSYFTLTANGLEGLRAIGARELARMKATAFLINTARGLPSFSSPTMKIAPGKPLPGPSS